MGSVTTGKPKVVSITYPSWAGEDYMAEFEKSFDLRVVVPSDRKGTVAALKAKVESDGPFDAIVILMGIGPYEPFDEELLKPLVPHCKLMVSASAGFNEFDVDWMTKNGIVFCNSRNAVNEATADLAIFFILGILRNFSQLQKSIARGKWRAGLPPVRDPSGLTLGMVGMGAIGKHVARKAGCFNMRVKYYKRTQLPADEEAKLGLTYCASLDELLASADVLSLHCPLNNETVGLIGKEQFAKMKDGVFLVNTCRGPIIDETALIEAMESGKVARAGLDVFHNEPNINPYFIDNERVMIQPHMGGLTDVAWQRAYREALENIKAFFATGKAISPVNAEEVSRLKGERTK